MIIGKRWSRDDPYTNDNVTITIGSVRSHEMTTEGAGIASKGTRRYEIGVDNRNAYDYAEVSPQKLMYF
jgi:hypothetical protein